MRLGRIALLPWREWAPAAFVSALVAVGGARLIVLSTQQRIAENREATADAAERTAASLEAELESLAERARREAARAVEVLGRSELREWPESVASDEEGFWTASDGSIVPAAYANGDAAAREALAREWQAADRGSESAGLEWLAPVRHGSQWLVAARVPIPLSNGNDVDHAGWAVVYRSLEDMLLRTDIAELPEQGYELAVGQPAPGRDALRLLTGSPFAASRDHVTGMIHLPAASRGADPSLPYMALALRPRGGWYSPARLTANIGLLLLVTWLLGVAARDLTHSQERWRAALAVARQRLVATNRRLSEEIEERRRLQISFEHARYHDTFTGLPNRRYFMKRLDQTLRERGGRRPKIAVILVDLNRFKLVNDTLGQTAGDELMVQAARRFENKLGEDSGHVLARWSGDQFALLLFDVHSSDTAVAFAKLLGDALVPPFILRKHALSVAAHMGITCVDTELQRTEDVVREADVALSAAKQRDAAEPVIYEAALGADVVSTVSLEADLHVALEREQLRLLFQPIVDLASGSVVGAEALLRWHHPVEGLLPPDRFLSIAEDARLIVPISRWVIRRACVLGDEWCRLARTDKGFYVSVNLAATVLDDPHLVPYVADVLRQTGLPAEALKFELTEGDLTRHVGAAREVLGALHDMGVRLVLDDFGTGHSSLSYLELFPIDCIKIDRPFVNPADGSDSDVMRSVVQMASSLGLEAVAEKVETEAAVQALKRMGCKYGQGYLLGEPVESERLLAHLARRALPASPVPPTLLQPALASVTPEAPTLLQPALASVTPDTPTLLQPALAPATSDTPTLVTRALEPPAPDAPTLVQRALELVTPDSPTLLLRVRPGTAVADEPTVERTVAADLVADDATMTVAVCASDADSVAPDAATAEHRAALLGGDVSDVDESTALVMPPPEALDGRARTRRRAGRRGLGHGRGA